MSTNISWKENKLTVKGPMSYTIISIPRGFFSHLHLKVTAARLVWDYDSFSVLFRYFSKHFWKSSNDRADLKGVTQLSHLNNKVFLSNLSKSLR